MSESRNHSTPVPATKVEKDQMWANDVIDGSFCIDLPGIYFLCVCPCGCGSMMNLPLQATEHPHPVWSWNGDRDKPTLQPSIRDLSGCRFHGFVTEGVWTFCPDSGVGANS